MVKNKNKSAKQKKSKAKRPVASSRMSRPNNPTFGAVSTINTAPVAIGNSMRGAVAQIIRSSNDQVRIVGRDYAQTAYGTGTISTWMLVAGFPLTPNCFVSSVLRNYCQMYNKFKFNRVRIHYITSSATSTSGDILFQINANRSDPVPNWTATNFLPYALSKPETIIGPQWTNHTVDIVPRGPIRNLDLGQNIDMDYQAQGEVLMYSKTSSTDSPGYLLIDYDINFYEMSVNPKVGLLPNPLLLYQPAQFTFPTTALTANSTTVTLNVGTTGSGLQSISAFTSNGSFKAGDIYKVVFDSTNTPYASWTFGAGGPITSAQVFAETLQSGNNALSLADGYTCYALVQTSSNVTLYGTITNAITGTAAFKAGSTFTPAAYTDNSHNPNAGCWLYCFVSYVGSVNPTSLQQQ